MMGEAFTRKPRSLNCLFFFFIAVQLLFAIRTEAMRELGLGAFLYILFNPAPISPVIPYPFAVGANRDKTAQGLYPREGFLQFCHQPLLFVFPLFSFGYVLHDSLHDGAMAVFALKFADALDIFNVPLSDNNPEFEFIDHPPQPVLHSSLDHVPVVVMEHFHEAHMVYSSPWRDLEYFIGLVRPAEAVSADIPYPVPHVSYPLGFREHLLAFFKVFFIFFAVSYFLVDRDGAYYPAVLGYGHRRVEYHPALFVKTLYLEFLVQGSLSVPDRPYSRPLVRGYLLACLSPPCLVFSKFFRPDEPGSSPDISCRMITVYYISLVVEYPDAHRHYFNDLLQKLFFLLYFLFSYFSGGYLTPDRHATDDFACPVDNR